MIESMRTALRGLVQRVSLLALDATGSLHMATLTGMKGVKATNVVRHKEFGMSTVPPKGSEGYAHAIGGKSDRLVVHGLDHKDYGPRDLQEGDTQIYDAGRSFLRMDANGITLERLDGKPITFKIGNMYLTLSADGIDTNAAAITNNGKHIDFTHTHGGILPGGANTAVPN